MENSTGKLTCPNVEAMSPLHSLARTHPDLLHVYQWKSLNERYSGAHDSLDGLRRRAAMKHVFQIADKHIPVSWTPTNEGYTGAHDSLDGLQNRAVVEHVFDRVDGHLVGLGRDAGRVRHCRTARNLGTCKHIMK